MDKKVLNCAIIGSGKIARIHTPNILATPEVKIVATCDVIEQQAKDYAAKFGSSYHTTSVDRVLSDPEIDAVIICTRQDSHVRLALEAASAGKHIFIEKPIADTIAETKRIQEAIHKAGVKLMSGWWFKHSPITKRVREVIPHPYYSTFMCRLPWTEQYIVDDEKGPFLYWGLLGTAGYNLHWLWHVMRSQPTEIYAMGYDKKATNTSSILIRFENGSFGNSVFTDMGMGGINPTKWYVEVQGGPRSAAIHGFTKLAFEGTTEPGIPENRYHDGFDKQWKLLADTCLNSKPSTMDAWEAAIPTIFTEKALESMGTGKPVPVDLRKEMYLPKGALPTSIAKFGEV